MGATACNPLHDVPIVIGRMFVALTDWMALNFARVMELLDVGAVADLPVLYVEFDAWCRDKGIHHGIDQFTLADFQIETLSTSYPHFRGKGSACKQLSVFLAHRLQQEPALVVQSWCAWALADFAETLDLAGTWLTDEQRARAARSGYTFLQTYMHLAELHMERLHPRYKVRPKPDTYPG